MAKPKLRAKARELRKRGWQLTDIAAELGVSYNTLRGWCRDIELTDEQIEALNDKDPRLSAQYKGAQKIKQKALEKRLEYQAVGWEATEQSNLLHLMGCMLYWGEGAKHRQHLRFTNTDPNMLTLFIRFLRDELEVPDDKIALQILSHLDETVWEGIRQYWLEILDLPSDCKVTITPKKGTKSRKSRYPYGICAINVYSIEVVQHIFGGNSSIYWLRESKVGGIMVQKKSKKRERARELRRMGWSYSEIVNELGVAKSSVSNWCSDIKLLPKQHNAIQERALEKMAASTGPETNRKNALKQRRQYQAAGREKAREGRFLHVVGCMLYWAEGAKTVRNRIHFANSDEQMLMLFVRFLREELHVPEDKLKVQIHCYARDNVEECRIEDYWLNLLGLRRDTLYETQVLNGSSKRHNRLENGVCTITVHSTEVLMHILGAIQEYSGFENEDWLL